MTDSVASIEAAQQVLIELGMPPAQQNERTALCLLALLDLPPGASWASAQDPLIGITPIMDWMRERYDWAYKPNSRESVRRQSMHQLCDAGVAVLNPDRPDRPVNSPKSAYQIEPVALELLRTVGTSVWKDTLEAYLSGRTTLVARYAREREAVLVPVEVAPELTIALTPGEHSELIGKIIQEFMPRFAPGSHVVYVGDTGSKTDHFDVDHLRKLGVEVDTHGKMPDVVLHFADRNWLLLVEAVTSHGPVDGKRHDELAALFAGSSAPLVYVTAFPDRASMSRYLGIIAWETEVWVADAPTHMIHFNGIRFLGPYGSD